MAQNGALVRPNRIAPGEWGEPASTLVGKSPAASRHNFSISRLAAGSVAAPARIIIGPQYRFSAKPRLVFHRSIDKNPPQRLQFRQQRGPFEGGIAEDQSVARRA